MYFFIFNFVSYFSFKVELVLLVADHYGSKGKLQIVKNKELKENKIIKINNVEDFD